MSNKIKTNHVVRIKGFYCLEIHVVRYKEDTTPYILNGIDKANKGIRAILETDTAKISEVMKIKGDYTIETITTGRYTALINLRETMYPTRGNKLQLYFADKTKISEALIYISPIDEYEAWDTTPMTKEERLDGLDIHGEPRR